MSRIAIVAALGAKSRAIGKDNKLLWHIPEDMRRFKELTAGHPVIMGRKTWESLPERFRPLPARTNIVVTRSSTSLGINDPSVLIAGSLEEAIAKAEKAGGLSAQTGADEIFVIGGGQLYAEALPLADRLYLTLIDDDKEGPPAQAGDVFFPPYESFFTRIVSDESREFNSLKYRCVTLERKD